MKRILMFAVAFCVAAVGVFAQGFTVQSVSGRVQRESGAARVDVVPGDVLSADTVIHTGLGATLVLREGDRTLSVPAARNGRVGELAAAGTGVRLAGTVGQVETGRVVRVTGQVSTAAARAGDAAGEDDIAAED